jgi:hypothetical protein
MTIKVLVENGITDLIELTLPIMGNDELTCSMYRTAAEQN